VQGELAHFLLGYRRPPRTSGRGLLVLSSANEHAR
jgi:hypothetical protein